MVEYFNGYSITATVKIFQSICFDELDMCLRNTDAPGGNKVKIWQNL